MTSPAPTVLLIGINDYTAYASDTSANLKGCVNDVFSYLNTFHRMGYQAADFRVLTDAAVVQEAAEGHYPMFGGSPEWLGEVDFVEATRQNILDAIATVAQRSSAEDSQGIVTYAGHGAFDADGNPVLCPSDTGLADGALTNTLDFQSIEDTLSQAGAGSKLTLLLDCCHAGGATSDNTTSRSLPGYTPPAATTSARGGDALLVLSACHTDQISVEYHFQGYWHGVFSWALIRFLERRIDQRAQDGTVQDLGISYATLRDRIRMMTILLECEQQAQFEGAQGDLDLPVFQLSGLGTKAANPIDDGRELWPGNGSWFREYHILDTTTPTAPVVVGMIISTKSGATGIPGGFDAGRDYWYLETDSSDDHFLLADASSIAIAVFQDDGTPGFAKAAANVVDSGGNGFQTQSFSTVGTLPSNTDYYVNYGQNWRIALGLQFNSAKTEVTQLLWLRNGQNTLVSEKHDPPYTMGCTTNPTSPAAVVVNTTNYGYWVQVIS